ncbi:MAG: glycerate kinase [Deinococcales bacterium]
MHRVLLEQTYFAALEATHPKKLVTQYLPNIAPSLILAIGKAALPMLEAARERFPNTRFLAVPPNTDNQILEYGEIVSGTHPVPSIKSVAAAERALEFVRNLNATDHVLVLISGGGSALFCAPWGVTLEQKQDITTALLKSGADIRALNTVRQALSRVKGGRFAAATKAKIQSLILSDVVGDDISLIASGPTAPNKSGFSEALKILEHYNIEAPEAIAHLQAGVKGKLPQPPQLEAARVQNKVIGSNFHLLQAAKAHLERQGYRAMILSDSFTGEARELARFHAAIIKSIVQHSSPAAAPLVLISGGEAPVTVHGNGMGGRNQEFLLWLLHELGDFGIEALAAGSDGIDGNSSAAGAFLSLDSAARAKQKNLPVQKFLENNDSGRFFAKLGNQFVTGATGHNLNDIRLIWIR